MKSIKVTPNSLISAIKQWWDQVVITLIQWSVLLWLEIDQVLRLNVKLVGSTRDREIGQTTLRNPERVRQMAQLLQVGNEERIELPLSTFGKLRKESIWKSSLGRCFGCVKFGMPMGHPSGYVSNWICECGIQRRGPGYRHLSRSCQCIHKI